jgi:hypothetical protein
MLPILRIKTTFPLEFEPTAQGFSVVTDLARALAVRELSPLELAQGISVPDAARLNNVAPATFKKAFPHLVRKIGLRREIVSLGDALRLPPPPE